MASFVSDKKAASTSASKYAIISNQENDRWSDNGEAPCRVSLSPPSGQLLEWALWCEGTGIQRLWNWTIAV